MLVLIRAKDAHLGEVVMLPIRYGGNIGPNATSLDGVCHIVHHHRIGADQISFSLLSAKHDDGDPQSGVKLGSEITINENELVMAFREMVPEMLAAHLYGDDPRLRR